MGKTTVHIPDSVTPTQMSSHPTAPCCCTILLSKCGIPEHLWVFSRARVSQHQAGRLYITWLNSQQPSAFPFLFSQTLISLPCPCPSSVLGVTAPLAMATNPLRIHLLCFGYWWEWVFIALGTNRHILRRQESCQESKKSHSASVNEYSPLQPKLPGWQK